MTINTTNTLEDLQALRFAKLTKRGNGMIHLPDSNIKLLLPSYLIEAITNSVTFAVVGEKSPEDTSDVSGYLTPFEGQLNITYFTGE
ncbi:MAG: hypothetical protein ACRCUS_01805 [Anaerovoracaceae bacterium]